MCLVVACYVQDSWGTGLSLSQGTDFIGVIALQAVIVRRSGSKPVRDSTGKTGDCCCEVGTSGDHVGIVTRSHAIIDLIVDDDVGSRRFVPRQRDAGRRIRCSPNGECGYHNEGDK